MSRIVSAALALSLAACSYEVATAPPQPPEPFTAYTDKVPGKWVLVVEAESATATPQASDLRCSQFDYPMDFSKAFVKLAGATFEKVAEDVRLSNHRLSHAEFVSGGYAGEVMVRVAEFRPRVKIEGLLEPTATADTEIAGTILVTKAGQRTLDASETGQGEATRDTGIACGGAADALSDASVAALQDLVRKLAEQFANSHAIRYSVPGLTPQ